MSIVAASGFADTDVLAKVLAVVLLCAAGILAFCFTWLDSMISEEYDLLLPPSTTDTCQHESSDATVSTTNNIDSADRDASAAQSQVSTLTTKDSVLSQVGKAGFFLLVVLPVLSVVPLLNVASKVLPPHNTLGLDLSGTFGTILDTTMSLIIILVNSWVIPQILQYLTFDVATAATLSLAGRSTFTILVPMLVTLTLSTHCASKWLLLWPTCAYKPQSFETYIDLATPGHFVFFSLCLFCACCVCLMVMYSLLQGWVILFPSQSPHMMMCATPDLTDRARVLGK